MRCKFYLMFFLVVVTITSCGLIKENRKFQNSTGLNSEIFWYDKDLILDTFYGISLERWYAEKPNKTNQEIIVAVLDMQLDINHEDLQGQIWINKNEIPNNGIDDDNNGYVDDVNGWNFVGKPNGGYFIYGNFEYVRVIQKWEKVFKNKDSTQIPEKLLNDYYYYNSAKNYHKYYVDYHTNWREALEFDISVLPVINDSLKLYFPEENYTLKDLDSLYDKYKINDKPYWKRKNDNDRDLGALLSYKINIEKNERTIENLIYNKGQKDSIINKNLNINFFDRVYIKDNSTVLEKGYGNPIINSFKKLQVHSTKVSSLIAANRKNNIGVKGFNDNIKIMPLSISVSGDEHDKDIVMAIYYAVDNGAKVINMSFGKEFSLEQDWVSEAIQYAEKNNVLIIHSSGNDGYDLDSSLYYPTDVKYPALNEFSSNFINVGSISKRTDSTMVSSFSNYGKNNVDLFAPGEEIYVAAPNNEYKTDSGTSLAAPMVSGTAALIWLYYPTLTVQEVKNIILVSGVTIDKMVIKPGTENEMVHFSELCKTGKVLNTYNAMKMAEELSKKKK